MEEFRGTWLRMIYNIWFMDEYYFWMNGYTNKQNMQLSFDENLYGIEQAQLHPKKFTMWATFSSHSITGPIFFLFFFFFCKTVNGDVGIPHKPLSEDVISELKKWDISRKPSFSKMTRSHIWLMLFSCYCEKLSKSGWSGFCIQWHCKLIRRLINLNASLSD